MKHQRCPPCNTGKWSQGVRRCFIISAAMLSFVILGAVGIMLAVLTGNFVFGPTFTFAGFAMFVVFVVIARRGENARSEKQGALIWLESNGCNCEISARIQDDLNNSSWCCGACNVREEAGTEKDASVASPDECPLHSTNWEEVEAAASITSDKGRGNISPATATATHYFMHANNSHAEFAHSALHLPEQSPTPAGASLPKSPPPAYEDVYYLKESKHSSNNLVV